VICGPQIVETGFVARPEAFEEKLALCLSDVIGELEITEAGDDLDVCIGVVSLQVTRVGKTDEFRVKMEWIKQEL
jgi:hypothetical protein